MLAYYTDIIHNVVLWSSFRKIFPICVPDSVLQFQANIAIPGAWGKFLIWISRLKHWKTIWWRDFDDKNKKKTVQRFMNSYNQHMKSDFRNYCRGYYY